MYHRANKKRGGDLKIVVTGGLGDHLLASAFVRYFSKCGRYVRITCVCHQSATQLFDMNPHIDRLISCPGSDLFLWAIPEPDCDIFSPYVDVAAPDTFRPGMHLPVEYILSPNLISKPVVLQVAQHHHIPIDSIAPEVFTTPQDDAWAEQIVRTWKGKPAVFLNTRSHLPEKNLPIFLKHKLIERLAGHAVLLQIETDVPPIPGITNLSPIPTIRQSAALFKRFSCIVTVDSFAGHLARAVGTPAVVFFGPSNPKTFGHPENLNLQGTACEHCADTLRKIKCTRSICMESLPIERAAEAVLELTAKRFEPPKTANLFETTL